ncbi:hypothetical protein chiPu_0018055 [Chiloscyllium punctatum]|uniref:Uncharacterized protein n=1 Tax=Chiloscyllium punctatum TaxID=137246 RepID=A0A401RKU3_CHIPU|nr:hypothetical protein [Chiloscyllium punctatum]
MVGLATDNNNIDAVNREVRPNYEIIKMTKMAWMNKVAVNRDKTVTRTILTRDTESGLKYTRVEEYNFFVVKV